MLVHYCKRKVGGPPDTIQKASPLAHEPVPPLQGLFPSCEDCPYPGSGLLCYAVPGDCLKTEMQKIMDKEENRVSESMSGEQAVAVTRLTSSNSGLFV